MYKLRDWIKKDNLNWSFLSENSNAISLLENNQDNIDWYYLSTNLSAIYLL